VAAGPGRPFQPGPSFRPGTPSGAAAAEEAAAGRASRPRPATRPGTSASAAGSSRTPTARPLPRSLAEFFSFPSPSQLPARQRNRCGNVPVTAAVTRAMGRNERSLLQLFSAAMKRNCLMRAKLLPALRSGAITFPTSLCEQRRRNHAKRVAKESGTSDRTNCESPPPSTWLSDRCWYFPDSADECRILFPGRELPSTRVSGPQPHCGCGSAHARAGRGRASSCGPYIWRRSRPPI